MTAKILDYNDDEFMKLTIGHLKSHQWNTLYCIHKYVHKYTGASATDNDRYKFNLYYTIHLDILIQMGLKLLVPIN